MPKTFCIACGALIHRGSSCPQHAPARRGARWRRTRAQVLARDRYRCWCGEPATEVDHLQPRTDGRQDHPENLRAVCGSHNPRGGDSNA